MVSKDDKNRDAMAESLEYLRFTLYRSIDELRRDIVELRRGTEAMRAAIENQDSRVKDLEEYLAPLRRIGR